MNPAEIKLYIVDEIEKSQIFPVGKDLLLQNRLNDSNGNNLHHYYPFIYAQSFYMMI
jgi:hypothetical protein